MQITRETDYAIRCILHISENPQRVTVVDEIATAKDIPKSFLAKILQKLAKANIVISTRGVKGGFRLAVSPVQISLLDIIEAVQGPLLFNICVLDKKSCNRSNYCSVHPVWVKLQADLVKKLGSINFKKLIKEESAFFKANSKQKGGGRLCIQSGKCQT